MYHVHPFSHACSTSNTLHKDYIKKDGLSSLISDFITFFQGFFILSPFSNIVHFKETAHQQVPDPPPPAPDG